MPDSRALLAVVDVDLSSVSRASVCIRACVRVHTGFLLKPHTVVLRLLALQV